MNDDTSSAAFNSVLESFAIDTLDRDLFLGDPGAGSGRLFGGLVAAQSVIAAGRTVETGELHSLHAYFLRPGVYGRPIRFVVDRIRDGRTFTTRRVVALQGGETIFNLSASFTSPGESEEHQEPRPEVPPPSKFVNWEEVRAQRTSDKHPTPTHARAVEALVSPEELENGTQLDGARAVWMRASGVLPKDPLIHAAFTIYASDRTLVGTVTRPMKAVHFRDLQVASLDHAMWFHNRPRFEGWMLYVSQSPAARAGRGLAVAGMYHEDGTRICSVAQEVLLRVPRS